MEKRIIHKEFIIFISNAFLFCFLWYFLHKVRNIPMKLYRYWNFLFISILTAMCIYHKHFFVITIIKLYFIIALWTFTLQMFIIIQCESMLTLSLGIFYALIFPLLRNSQNIIGVETTLVRSVYFHYLPSFFFHEPQWY